MIAKIVYWIGVILAIWCVVDLFKNHSIGLIWKIIISILILGTSFVGLLIYYFILRNLIK